MTTGLYVGRFQPFHLGHLEAVKHILSQVDELVIVVGSAHDSHTLENPFTAGERISMIRLALKEAKIDANRFTVLPLPDAEFHKVWVSHLLSQTPSFERLFFKESSFRRKRRSDQWRNSLWRPKSTMEHGSEY